MNNEEGGVGLEFLTRVDEFEVEVAQETGADLVDLEEGQVTADAEMTTTAKLKTGEESNVSSTHSPFWDKVFG